MPVDPASVPPLNIEVCVQLLERLADAAAGRSAADVDYAERHERTHQSVATDHYLSAARFAAEATLLGALASALRAMGKDSDAIDALERGEIELECMGTTVRYFNIHVANGPMLTTAGGRHLREVLAEALSAARAAQPAAEGPARLHAE